MPKHDKTERQDENSTRYAVLRDRLEALGYNRHRTDTTTLPGTPNHVLQSHLYVRRADGQRLRVDVESTRDWKIENLDVYKEVSTSIQWTEYLAAIS